MFIRVAVTEITSGGRTISTSLKEVEMALEKPENKNETATALEYILVCSIIAWASVFFVTISQKSF